MQPASGFLVGGTATSTLYAPRFGLHASLTSVMGTKLAQRFPNSALIDPWQRGFKISTSPWSQEHLQFTCLPLSNSMVHEVRYGQKVSTFTSINRCSAAETAKNPRKPPHYHPPQKGFLSRLPAAWVPYAELMRLDKPAGLYLFYFPYLFGTLYGACLSEPVVPPSYVFVPSIILLAGTMVMRGAACSWNDTIDRDLDRKVASGPSHVAR